MAMEKMALIRLKEHLTSSNILHLCQSDFRLGYDTRTLLAEVLESLLIAMDRGQMSILILLDITVVFDTVDNYLHLAYRHFRAEQSSTKQASSLFLR